MAYRVGTADGLEAVAATLQTSYDGLGVYEPVGRGGIGMAVDGVADGAGYLGTLDVGIYEAEVTQAVALGHLDHIAAQECGARRERQHRSGRVGLAGGIGYRGVNGKVVHKVRLVGIGNRHGNGDGKGARGIGNHLARRNLCIVGPRGAITPPKGCAAQHVVLNLGTLNGHAGIADGSPGNRHGIAHLIAGLHGVHVYPESDALVLLDRNGNRLAPAVAHAYPIGTRQGCRGQHKTGRSRTVAVGGNLLLGHDLVVGILELQGILSVGQHISSNGIGNLVGH